MPPEPQPLTDEQLARQTQAGSMAAFEELVIRFERRIYGFVASTCHCRADAKDITQESFVRAFQSIARFDCRQSFATWLFTIARHLCVDHYRAASPEVGSPVPESADLDDPSELLARQEERADLWRLARGQLPELQYQALWLRYAAEMRIEEIAHVLGKTRTHVKVLLFRARAMLGQALEAARGGPSKKMGVPMSERPPEEVQVSRITHHALVAPASDGGGSRFTFHVSRFTSHL